MRVRMCLIIRHWYESSEGRESVCMYTHKIDYNSRENIHGGS